MPFTTYRYIAFLIVAVIFVRVTRGTPREWGLVVLSFVFYAAWDVRYVPLLLGLALFTYFAGHAVAADRDSRARWVLPVIVVICVLAVYKYSGMLAEGANLFLPRDRALTIPEIVLPLGISFFTFECISYLVDVHKGSKELLPLRRFLLFPAFFPHMIAGPILRIREFAPQFDKLRRANYAEILAGAERIMIGFVKKLVFADQLGAFVDAGFGGGTAPGGLDSWVLAIAFAFQIYFDFSAYSDIAIGSARMLGFTFPENFNLPYHAKTPADFWNRWHMTLSRWIRDYLFFPLLLRAGDRIWLRYVHIVFVMAIMGLWHGAGLTFILWGVWHGCLLVAHRVLQGPVSRLAPDGQRMLGRLGYVATLAMIFAGAVLFRARTVHQAGDMLGAMFTLHNLTPAYSPNDYALVLFCIAAYYLLEPVFQRWTRRDPNTTDFGGWAFWMRAPLYTVAIQLVFMFEHSNVGFIYFQF